MRSLKFWCTVAVVVASAVLSADDHTVLFDRDIDFSTFRTFAMNGAVVKSERPELKFPAVSASVTDAVRGTLAARGLAETGSSSDLSVDIRVTSDDYGIGPFGRPNVIEPPQPGRRGRAGGLTFAYTEATLVVDLTRRSDALLIWRGVYRDSEKAPSKFAETLPKDALELLSAFPPNVRKAK